jgi:hypothetical protein
VSDEFTSADQSVTSETSSVPENTGASTETQAPETSNMLAHLQSAGMVSAPEVQPIEGEPQGADSQNTDPNAPPAEPAQPEQPQAPALPPEIQQQISDFEKLQIAIASNPILSAAYQAMAQGQDPAQAVQQYIQPGQQQPDPGQQAPVELPPLDPFNDGHEGYSFQDALRAHGQVMVQQELQPVVQELNEIKQFLGPMVQQMRQQQETALDTSLTQVFQTAIPTVVDNQVHNVIAKGFFREEVARSPNDLMGAAQRAADRAKAEIAKLTPPTPIVASQQPQVFSEGAGNMVPAQPSGPTTLNDGLKAHLDRAFSAAS